MYGIFESLISIIISILVLFILLVIIFYSISKKKRIKTKYNELVNQYNAKYVLSVYYYKTIYTIFEGLKRAGYLIINDDFLIFTSNEKKELTISIKLSDIQYWNYGDNKYHFYIYFSSNVKHNQIELGYDDFNFNKYSLKHNNFFEFLQSNIPNPPKENIEL